MDWMIDGGRALGVGLICGGYVVISARHKRRKLAASGDEDAKTKLENGKTVETVAGPLVLVAGICLLIVATYADYQKLRTPLSPDKALEKAMENLRKLN